MRDKAVNNCLLAFTYTPDYYKIQKSCGRAISENPLMLVHDPDKYKTQKMCGKAVDDCLVALKLIPD